MQLSVSVDYEYVRALRWGKLIGLWAANGTTIRPSFYFILALCCSPELISNRSPTQLRVHWIAPTSVYPLCSSLLRLPDTPFLSTWSLLITRIYKKPTPSIRKGSWLVATLPNTSSKNRACRLKKADVFLNIYVSPSQVKRASTMLLVARQGRGG